MKIIINADDFGYSSDVNKSIVKAFEERLITSTTILANMSGFEEAIKLSKTNGFMDSIGIHLNLFEGRPLTKDMQKCRLFCNANGDYVGEKDNNGIYRGKRIRIFDPLLIPPSVIFNELSAQIEKVLNTGIEPTHLDSHGQIHTNFFIGGIVIKLAKKYKIPSIRINSNLRNRRNLLSELEIILYNYRLKKYGIKVANYVGTIPEIAMALPQLKGVIEIIVHPICKKGTIVDIEFEGELSQLLAPFEDYEKISYNEL